MHKTPRYRVDVWMLSPDGGVTLRAVNLRSHISLAVFVLAIAHLQAERGGHLPQIAEISTLH